MCLLRDLSICQWLENEFPTRFKGLGSHPLTCLKGKPKGIVDRTLDAPLFRGWIMTDRPSTPDDDTWNGHLFPG